MFEFDGNSRRRTFDRTNNNNSEQNSTGYSEKTVFPTNFGSPENNNYQNGYAQSTVPQNNAFGGDALNPAQANGYVQPAQPQNYGYAAMQSATPVATAPVGGLPMVFASRTHKDVYVYEYHDRLEWYLKTATCMHLFNIEKKSK
ncbi:MAG: hypothetical protein K2I75_03315 [Clostridiales bacterium]|nr:hypothetical protein [Clostridiales bacterium]